MKISRHYELVAGDGNVDALRGALRELSAKVRPMAGCEGVDIFQDADKPEIFYFIEHWASREQQSQAGKALGKSAFAPLMACVGRPPVGRFLARVDSAG